MCAAPKGNQFWKLRSKNGRNKLFSTPELLWEAACEYFAYCDNHPWKVLKNKKKGKTKEEEECPTQCPYTLTGLCAYLDVGEEYWRNFKKEGHEGFSWVITRVENIIKSQQLQGAMVGAYNANIVSRINGLADKQEIDHSGNITTGFTVVVSSKEEAELLERLKGK